MMSHREALDAAVAVFRELGWDRADQADVLRLPLGTPEQQRTARAGLKSGDWREWASQVDPSTGRTSYRWMYFFDVSPAMLALFAVRQGVDTARAARLLREVRDLDDSIAVEVIVARGEEYASHVLRDAYRSVSRAWEHTETALGGLAVRLVERLQLPIPDDVDYLKDWVALAWRVLVSPEQANPRGVPSDIIQPRYAEYAHAAVAAGVHALGPFVEALTVAVERGWINRIETVGLAFEGLDAAQRPGDRKAWLQLLKSPLAATDDEFLARADALVTTLSHGDAFAIDSIAPILIRDADEPVLLDVVTLGLTSKTKKARLATLKAAATRTTPPQETREAVAPLVADLLDERDRPTARAAQTLVDAWQLSPESADGTESEVRGLWHPTPEVWDVPRFDLGEISADALTQSAALLVRRNKRGLDVEVERFLALANGVAYQDGEQLRSALAGVQPVWVNGLSDIRAVLHEEQLHSADVWPEGTDHSLGSRLAGGITRLLGTARPADFAGVNFRPLDIARDGAVALRLGEVPCLLSTPSWVDLRIDPAELLQRLKVYAWQDAVASEADLFVALTRLDHELMTDDLRAGFRKLDVAVVLQNGLRLGVKAGPAVVAYAADPVVDPGLKRDDRWWVSGDITTPDSLKAFPPRLVDLQPWEAPGLAIFPAWGDTTYVAPDEEDGAVGVAMRQLVRRARPLSPAQAIGLLAAQRSSHEAAAADLAVAVEEAWERGLLQPGVADVRYLDGGQPRQLAAMATAFGELAEQGMLSVVWPVLDALLTVSLGAPRMLAGTAEVMEAIESLLPEVLAAVNAGSAGPDVLGLPGVRALADRGGSSRAVRAAKAVVAQLPEITVEAAPSPEPEPPVDFDAIWPADAGTAPAVEDGVAIEARWIDPEASTKRVAVIFTLPETGERYWRRIGWFYDLENEGQCAVERFDGELAERSNWDGWLRWDRGSRRIVVADERNGMVGPNGPLPSTASMGGPLTVAMSAVFLAALGDGGDGYYYVVSALKNGILASSAAIRSAIRQLLESPDVSPARMMRLLEKTPQNLPVLWPLLTESVRFAAAQETPPRWLNRILDVALIHAPILAEAARRGLIPADDAAWPGLVALAERPGSSTALKKARQLRAALS